MTDAFWVSMGGMVAAGLAAGLPGFFAWKTAQKIKVETAEIKHQTNSELTKLRGELSELRGDLSEAVEAKYIALIEAASAKKEEGGE